MIKNTARFVCGVIAWVCLTVSAFGSVCPHGPDIDKSLTELLANLHAAPSEIEAHRISAQLWDLWAVAPNEPAQALLDQGINKRAVNDVLGALADFNALVSYCPNYAEGYNQRAFTRFLQGDTLAALDDLSRAIELSPRHVGAIVGRAMLFLHLQEFDSARDDLERAVALNPWLRERALIEPGGVLADETRKTL